MGRGGRWGWEKAGRSESCCLVAPQLLNARWSSDKSQGKYFDRSESEIDPTVCHSVRCNILRLFVKVVLVVGSGIHRVRNGQPLSQEVITSAKEENFAPGITHPMASVALSPSRGTRHKEAWGEMEQHVCPATGVAGRSVLVCTARKAFLLGTLPSPRLRNSPCPVSRASRRQSKNACPLGLRDGIGLGAPWTGRLSWRLPGFPCALCAQDC